ncbi:MAG: hypothetical protein ACK5KO_03515, partial [Arachnia sp.]
MAPLDTTGPHPHAAPGGSVVISRALTPQEAEQRGVATRVAGQKRVVLVVVAGVLAVMTVGLLSTGALAEGVP